MDLKRIFANALARRIAYLIVAALLAALGLGEARAQAAYSCPATLSPKCDQGAAYAAASARQGACPTGTTNGALVRVEHSPNGASGSYIPYFKCMNGAVVWYEEFQGFNQFYGSSCATRPSQITTRLPLNGSQQCLNGCMYSYRQNGDDETSTRSPVGGVCSNTKDNCPTATFYNFLMNVCQPLEPDCPDGQQVVQGVCKPAEVCPEGMVAVQASTPGAIAAGELYCKPSEQECPAGNIKAPSGQCLPGEGQCAAGEAKKKDGTCGKDANNDGVADDDDADEENDTTKETFSGGDSCNAPPSCNGSAIMCGQARIQWRIDCNTRKSVNISGGSCSAVPICTGEKCNAMEYNSLIMQWRTACALEKAKDTGGGTTGGNQDLIDHLTASKQAEVNAIRAQGTNDGFAGDEENKIWAPQGTGQVPSSGLLGGGGATCTFAITIRGKAITMSPQGYQILAFIHWLFVAAAYVWVAVQLGK